MNKPEREREREKSRRGFFKVCAAALGIKAAKEKIPSPFFDGDWFSLLNEAEGHNPNPIFDAGHLTHPDKKGPCPEGHFREVHYIPNPGTWTMEIKGQTVVIPRPKYATWCKHRGRSSYLNEPRCRWFPATATERRFQSCWDE